MNKVAFSIPLFLYSLNPFNALLAEDIVSEDTLRLGTMVISGTRSEKELMDVPVSMTVITEKEIKRSGADQIGEILRDVPGVEITDTSVAGAKRVRIRGEVGSNVLILIDGQEISEQRSFHGAAPLLIDMNIVERIEIIKGPGSVLYGSKAIGGVVNFITRKGGDNPVEFELNASYNTSTNGYDSNAQIYGSSNNFDYRLSLSKSDHGDRKVPDGTNDNVGYLGKDGVLENSSFDNSNINAYLAYNTEKLTFGGRFEDYKADTESHTDNSILEDLDGFQLDLPRRDRRKISLFAEAKNITDSVVKARFDIYHQTRDRDFTQDLLVNSPNFAGPGSNIAIDLDLGTVFEQKTSGIQGQIDLMPHKDHYIIAGFDYMDDRMDSNVSTKTQTTGTVPFPPFTLFDATDQIDYFVESGQKTKAIFLQDEWSFAENFSATAGIRQTWVETELDETDSSVLTKIDSDNARLVGSLALMYSGMENTVLRAGWSQGFRVPSLLELLEGTPHGGSGVLHSNPNLDPEKSNNFEMGLRFDNGKIAFDSAIFYTRAKDYVATVGCASSTTSCPENFGRSDTQYINVNGATTYGLELFGSYSFSESPLSLYSNVTLLRREFEYSQFSSYDTGNPVLQGRIGLMIETEKNAINYWGDLFLRAATDADEETPNSSLPDGKENDHYEGWATLNMAIGSEFGGEYPVRLSLNFNNIFDKTYTTARETLIAPERHVVFNVGINF